MTHDIPDAGDETNIIPSSASDPLKMVFERFMAHYTPFGFQARSDEVEFHPMPYVPGKDDEFLLSKPWRVLLELYNDARRRVVGLDLYGDVILGRGESQPGRIILDLEPYGAQETGVSREHMMLRPTAMHLFAIDRGSTNGTTVNGAPTGRGVAVPLKNEDLIALGEFVLMLHIINKPESA